MAAKPLNTNDMAGVATGLATVSRQGAGGALSSFAMISYMGYLPQNFFAKCRTHFRTLTGGCLARGLLDEVRVRTRGSDTMLDTICGSGVFSWFTWACAGRFGGAVRHLISSRAI